jgi:hypothetical protein
MSYKDPDMTPETPNTGAIVARLFTALVVKQRIISDFCSEHEDLDAFNAAIEAHDEAVTTFCKHTCTTTADLAVYSEVLWGYLAIEHAESIVWGEDSTAPTTDFWQIAAAVRRESRRLLSPSCAGA